MPSLIRFFGARGAGLLCGSSAPNAKVAPNAWYPGATDTFSFKDLPSGDEPEVKGVLVLDATSGRVRHHAVPGGRPLRSFRLDAHGLTVPEIHLAVAELVPPEGVDGAVVRLFVDQARPEVRCSRCSYSRENSSWPAEATA